MKPRFRYGTYALILALCTVFTAGRAMALTVENIRVGIHPDKTRVVVDLSGMSKFRAVVLDSPWRMVVDLPDFDWQVGKIANPPQSPIRSIKQGSLQPGISRIVLDLKEPVSISDAFLLRKSGNLPDRLVIDFTKTTAERYSREKGRTYGLLDSGAVETTAAAAPPSPLPDLPAPESADRQPPALQQAAAANTIGSLPQRKPAPAAPMPTARAGRPVIVIDPGHGGVDPGAVGPDGIFEKHVALAMAKDLKALLDGTGRYDVRLTRDRDIYLRLTERVELARKHKADLFISLHADSIGKSNVSGASVYTLSENASDEQTARLADRENKADIIAGTDLSHEDEQVAGILIDIAMRDTMNQSNFFANTLVSDLESTGITILERPHRSAGFAVLKAPDTPSILVEMGFMSNKSEARLLSTPAYRQKVARALVSGIDGYFEKTAREGRI